MSRPQHRDESGFSFVEVLISIVVLSLIALGLAQGLAMTNAGLGAARVQSVATNLATAEVERVQRLDYEQVGTVGGNPPGTIPALRTETVRSVAYEIAVAVAFVNDPAQGQPVTNLDYKRVRITVTPAAPDGARKIVQTTLVAPPNYVSIAGKATITADVSDPFVTPLAPLEGVTVTAFGSTSPTRTAVSDATDALVFAGLEPSATSPDSSTYHYRLAAEKSGYVVRTSEEVLRENLAAGQTWPATIELFRPVELQVNLRDAATGQPVAEDAKVTLTGPSPDFAVAQLSGRAGSFRFSQLAGRLIEPSANLSTITVNAPCYARPPPRQEALPPSYPDQTLTVLDFALQPAPGGSLRVTVLDATTGLPISGAAVAVGGGPDALAPESRPTDAAGIDERRCLAPSGTQSYQIGVTAPGYAGATAAASVQLGQTSSVVVRLSRLGTASIRVKLEPKHHNKLTRLRLPDGSYDRIQRAAGPEVLYTQLVNGDYLFSAAEGPSENPPSWGREFVLRADSAGPQPRVYEPR